jgi:hypothetical protein
VPDLVTSKIFVDGEKGITAAKMNQIISGAVIQPSFVSSKPASSTLDPTDQILELKGAGSYATITGQQLIDSVSSSVTQNIQPTIWSVRLRSFNATGNPNFEVDQRQVGLGIGTGGGGVVGFAQDRWYLNKNGSPTGTLSAQQTAGNVNLPGTSFCITQNFIRITVKVSQASLGTGDAYHLVQWIEGPQLRELINDVHSLSFLARSSIANLKFSVALRDSATAKSLVNLITLGATANTWTLVTFPNLPLWQGTYPLAPGSIAAYLHFTFAAGANLVAPAAGTWQSGNFFGAPGADNFLSNAVNSTIDIAAVQHEPGSQCSTLQDKSFLQNFDECQRYFQKTYDYATAVNSAVNPGMVGGTSIGVAMNIRPGITFVKRMARQPTLTIYSSSGGAANTAYNLTAGAPNTAITSTGNVGEAGYALNASAAPAGSSVWQWHHVADTLW